MTTDTDLRFIREIADLDLENADRDALVTFSDRWSFPVYECSTRVELETMDLDVLRTLVDSAIDGAADAINSRDVSAERARALKVASIPTATLRPYALGAPGPCPFCPDWRSNVIVAEGNDCGERHYAEHEAIIRRELEERS